MGGAETSYKRIGAVKTTVAVLRAMSESGHPITGQGIAQRIGIPFPTIMCHLATLEDEGLVRQVGDCYELGMGLMLFWAKYRSQLESKIDGLTKELKQLEV